MIHIDCCVPKRLPTQLQHEADRLAIFENPDNAHQVAGLSLGRLRLALATGNKWANGRTLHVRFLNGSHIQHTKTEAMAHLWETWANIKFVFDNSPSAEIRVSFYDITYPDTGSWSYVGTDVLTIPSTMHTMHFGWLTDTTSDAEYQRVVVHEFGHTLGCVHEDQQPAAHIAWDRPAVYAYYMAAPNNFTRAEVDSNVLNVLSERDIEHTEFDGTSIMAYSIPPEFTLDRLGIPGGSTLSPMDKMFIARAYPHMAPPQPPPDPGSARPSSQLTTLLSDGIWVNGIFATPTEPCLFNLIITRDGHVQVIGSIVGAGIDIFVNGVESPIASSIRQITAFMKAGTYKLSIHPNPTHTVASFRIMAHFVR